ncbi:MAG: hypothetical protein V4597_19330 [Pseudomonadota bacterium]
MPPTPATTLRRAVDALTTRVEANPDADLALAQAVDLLAEARAAVDRLRLLKAQQVVRLTAGGRRKGGRTLASVAETLGVTAPRVQHMITEFRQAMAAEDAQQEEEAA